MGANRGKSGARSAGTDQDRKEGAHKPEAVALEDITDFDFPRGWRTGRLSVHRNSQRKEGVMTAKTNFRGSFTALVTPFKNGSLDEQMFRDLVEWQIAEGTNGLVP